MRFLSLGDSYTIGEGVPQNDSWPFQLVAALRQNGLLVEDPIVIAKTGWTTGELQEAIAREKQLKNWQRKWKIRLIEENNVNGDDLSQLL